MAVPACDGCGVGGLDTRLHDAEALVFLWEEREEREWGALQEVGALVESFVDGEITVGEAAGQRAEGSLACTSVAWCGEDFGEEEDAIEATVCTRSGGAVHAAIQGRNVEVLRAALVSCRVTTCGPVGFPLDLTLPAAFVNVYRDPATKMTLVAVSVSLEALVMLSMGLPSLQSLWTLEPSVVEQVAAALRRLADGASRGVVLFRHVSVLQHVLERQVCFWLPEDYASSGSAWNCAAFNAFLQSHYGGAVARVCLKSDYVRTELQRSHNYRLTLWSPHAALADSELTELTNALYTLLPERFGVVMR